MYTYDLIRYEFSRKMSQIAFDQIYAPVLGATAALRMDLGPDGPSDPDLRGTDIVGGVAVLQGRLPALSCLGE